MVRLLKFGLSAALLSAVLPCTSLAQSSQRENPYSDLLSDAKQVIVHIPKLGDGNLVNALKVVKNLDIPLRVLTTEDGLMQQNGLILRLVVLDIPVYPLKLGGDKRSFIEVEKATGWNVYEISSGSPVRKSMLEFTAFNKWYGQNIRTMPVYSPPGAVALWARAHLGYKLTNGSIQPSTETVTTKPPAFLNNLPAK